MKRLSKPAGKFLMLVVILAVLVGLGMAFDFDQKQWMEYFNRIPLPLAGILFVAAYVCITFFVWFAKDIFRIVGALVFGPYWSTLFIWIGELSNAAIFFFMSRKLGRSYVVDKFHLKGGELEKARRKGGVWHIFVLRSFPLIPFRVLDLAYGLSSVSFRKYWVVSALAMPVRIFWVQFIVAALGGAILDLQKVRVYFQQNAVALWLSFLYLVLSIATVLLLRRKIR